MNSQPQNRMPMTGYLFAVISTAIWAGNFIVARSLNQSITPISLAFWRWLVAVIVIFPFSQKQLFAEQDIIRKNLPYLSITALLGITLFNTLVYLAGRSTTAINLSLISITFPVFIVILSRILYREAITIYKGIGIILVTIGVIFLVSKGNPSSLFHLTFVLGDLWMLLAALIFAVYSILLKHRPGQLSFWAFQSSLFILGFIFLLPLFMIERTMVPPVEFNTKMILSILYVGIFASFSAFILWNKSVEMVGPSRAGMIYYTSPLFSGLWATLFLQEKISIIHFYSVLLILSGIIVSNYSSKINKFDRDRNKKSM